MPLKPTAISLPSVARMAVDLTTPNRTPLKAITVAGRCFTALREAGVPDDERQALMDLLARTARDSVTSGGTSHDALVEGMNEEGTRMLHVAQQHLVVAVNWATGRRSEP
jgi:hypothetical protein